MVATPSRKSSLSPTGKTTFLSVLSGRAGYGMVDGEIFYCPDTKDGEPMAGNDDGLVQTPAAQGGKHPPRLTALLEENLKSQRKLPYDKVKNATGFVPQDDILHETLTVRRSSLGGRSEILVPLVGSGDGNRQ